MLILCHVCSGELSRRANLRDKLEATTNSIAIKMQCLSLSSKAKRKQPSQANASMAFASATMHAVLSPVSVEHQEQQKDQQS